MRRRWSISVLLLLIAAGIVVARWWNRERENRYDSLISECAPRNGLPPALVKAVVWQESRFVESARGGKGELGLMQITEDAAVEWAAARRMTDFRHSHVLNARTNLEAGCHYLGKLMKRYRSVEDPSYFALADYNAGRGNVLRWMRTGMATNAASLLACMDFPGTREYIRRIQERRGVYEAEFR